MFGRRLSWLDVVVMVLSWGPILGSRFEVELEGPARLNSHRGEILTRRLRNSHVSAFQVNLERDFW